MSWPQFLNHRSNSELFSYQKTIVVCWGGVIFVPSCLMHAIVAWTLVVRILGKHEGRILLREPQFALSHYPGLPDVSSRLKCAQPVPVEPVSKQWTLNNPACYSWVYYKQCRYVGLFCLRLGNSVNKYGLRRTDYRKTHWLHTAIKGFNDWNSVTS